MLVLAILWAGLALRLYRLGAESLWLDEMGQASVSSGSLLQALAGARRHHGAAPLDYLLTWLALQIAHSDFVVRLPAALVGILTLALVYRLGEELFDRPTGLLGMALLAGAPLHLRFSQEARFYALFTALAVASTLTLVIALRQNTWRGWALYAVTLVAGLYTHYYMPLVVLAHGLAVLWKQVEPSAAVRQQPHVAAASASFTAREAEQPAPSAGGARSDLTTLGGFLLSCMAAAVAFLPWLFYAVLHETGTPLATPPQLSWTFLNEMHARLVLGPGNAELLPGLRWLYGGLALLGVIGGLIRWRTRLGTLLLLLPVLLSPPLIILALRQVGYFFAIRQVLFLLPFYLLLVARGIVALACWLAGQTRHRKEARLQAGIPLLLAAALLVPLAPAIKGVLELPRQDWRDALAFVAANARPEDTVLSPRVPNRYFRYYAPDLAPRMANPESVEALKTVAAHSPATWTLIFARSGDLGRQARRWLEQAGALRLDFGPEMTVYYYRPGVSANGLLLDALHWLPPRLAQPMEQLTYLYDAADMPEAAASAALQAAALATSVQKASFYQTLRGNVWRKRGDNRRAIEAYRQALRLWPQNTEALVRLGERLIADGRADEATMVLLRATRLAPDNYWAHRLLGEAYWRQQRVQEALAAFQAAIAVNPDEPETYFRLGSILADTGDIAAAIAAYRRYLMLAPDGPRVAAIRQRLAALQAEVR